MNKSKLFHTAWEIFRAVGGTFSAALVRAWKLMKLRTAMINKVVNFTYRKVDGSIRHAAGTLNVPYEHKGAAPVHSTFTYYDTVKQGWRSARVEKVLL